MQGIGDDQRLTQYSDLLSADPQPFHFWPNDPGNLGLTYLLSRGT